jgi:hypothetical protein
MVENEATWCAGCWTVFHRDCLARADTICIVCRRTYDSPERHFVYSQFCPECMQPNDPPQAQCSACRAATRWDTRADYDRFLIHMKQTARMRLVRGLAELGGGILCMISLVTALALTRPSIGALCMFMFGFMVLTADGVASLMKSNDIRRFK